ncbi:50S ribosomal protein L1 [Thermogymnomonas acidicola]|uniref:Large ribosomal subunit protein uL1 n=1 Tax=Thermogymnomonas acidicola TaxID=399579 RepID=A0AA37F952_9ARCH|nr:50S ribosomal protein L1 [Thermogymnomonas acidicola]GGM71252.1 50S ribosomal protein L1 [Thermogymnomonas acidicola]
MADSVSKFVAEAKKQSKERKFLESLELAINLKDVDLSDPKNRINDELVLPNGRGKETKIAVIGSEELKAKARGSADLIFGPEDLSKFAENKKEFKKVANEVDFFIAESTLMANIGRTLGPVLGPRGKIPKPIPPGQDPAPMISALRKTVRIRTRDRRTFHVPVGTKSMKDEEIGENVTAVIKRVASKLEKGMSNIESVYIKTTMGKAVKIDVEAIK